MSTSEANGGHAGTRGFVEMAARGGKKRKGTQSGTAASGPCPRFLAVRLDVLSFMKDMEKENSSSVILQKWLNMAIAVLSGQERRVSTVMNILDADKIGNVWELGPKRRRGGAFRLFMTRQGRGSFFITAAVEKSQGGVREMSLAKARADEIAKAGNPGTLNEAKELFGTDYEIFTDAIALIKECRGERQ